MSGWLAGRPLTVKMRATAVALAASLAEDGYDVDVRPVTTYSLLGLAPDPVLSTMLFAYDELTLVEALCGLVGLDPRIGDGALEDLEHRLARTLGGEAKHGGGLGGVLATDEVDHPARLHRRDAHMARTGVGGAGDVCELLGVHQRRRPFLSSLM